MGSGSHSGIFLGLQSISATTHAFRLLQLWMKMCSCNCVPKTIPFMSPPCPVVFLTFCYPLSICKSCCSWMYLKAFAGFCPTTLSCLSTPASSHQILPSSCVTWPWLLPLLFFKDSLILKATVSGRERYFIHWVTPQIIVTASAWPVLSQKIIHPLHPMWTLTVLHCLS